MTLLRAKLFEMELEKQRRWGAGRAVPSFFATDEVGLVPSRPGPSSRPAPSASPPLPPPRPPPPPVRLLLRSEISAARRSQVGTGSRSEKIKTYNYKDSRMSGA